MRLSPLLVVAIVAGSLSFTPHATQAAGYKHFSSKICPYTIDYPSDWQRGGSKKISTESFGYRTSPTQGVGVVVRCATPYAGETTQALTRSTMRDFSKQGYGVAAPSYSGGAGIFKAQKTIRTGKGMFKALIEVSAFIERSKSWVIFLFADRASFHQALPIYEHMLTSFREK